jgi:hypothetical protein
MEPTTRLCVREQDLGLLLRRTASEIAKIDESMGGASGDRLTKGL